MSVELRDDTSESLVWRDPLAVSGYSQLEISFYFAGSGLDANEGFVLEANIQNRGWARMKTYRLNATSGQFLMKNGVRYSDKVVVYILGSSTVGLRFRSISSSDLDLVYIDDVTIQLFK